MHNKKIGSFKTGERNLITDVKGVNVGHKTFDLDNIQTGITAITLPNQPFYRYEAAAFVFNGFGKSVGLIQLNELGELETPIMLTNTYSVPAVMEGLIENLLKIDPERGKSKGTINPVVFECNDGYLNDIQRFYIRPKDVNEALESASKDFMQGSVGAGRGMSAYQMKGGIGSASRVTEIDGEIFTVGTLSLTNMGLKKDFRILGEKFYDEDILNSEIPHKQDKGSMINILITDIPLSHRQLNRVAKRCSIGLAHTGTMFSNGSGDIFLCVSTGNVKKGNVFEKNRRLCDSQIDIVFRMAIECTEDSVLSSIYSADTVKGRDGNIKYNINEDK